MPGLINDECNNNDNNAVQKGRMPKSPLEGSMVDQFIGINSNVNTSFNGFNNQQHISNYTNFLMRADSFSRFQHHQSNHHQQPFGLHQNNNNNNYNDPSNLYEMSTRLLFNTVEWARNVPFFSALPTTDQVALLKSSWSELYILNTSQHCSIYQLNARSLAPLSVSPQSENYINDQRPKRLSPGDSSEYSLKVFEELVEKFKHLQTDAAEFSCLKALVLFNPDSPGIANPSLIENLQEKAQSALEEYLRQHSSPNSSTRFGKLLLRLPALSLIRPMTIEKLFFSRIHGHHNVDNLVGSMLLYGNSQPGSFFNAGLHMNNTGFNGLGINVQQQSNLNNPLHNINGVLNSNGHLGAFPNGNGINLNNLSPHITNMNNLQTNGMNGMPLQYSSNSSLNAGGFPNTANSFTSGLLNTHSLLNGNRTQVNNNVSNNGTNLQNAPSPRVIVKSENPSR